MEPQQQNGHGRTTRSKRYVYSFGGGKADGNAGLNWLLGGKGANLAEMAGLGLPVPPGMTITTEVCTYYYAHQRSYPTELQQQVSAGLKRIEKIMGRRFGDPENPLLLSVRSGARVSMPGMMDTVLNLGLNDETVQGLIKQSNNERFAYDCYRRFVQMYGDVVLGLKPEAKTERDPFEKIIEDKKAARGIELDTEFTADDLRELVAEFKALIQDKLHLTFPQDPQEQLWGAIGAVFGSWNNPRAITYRKIENIPEEWGTAVTVQAMIFGNLGEDCATGVAFTRDFSTGAKELNGDFLVNAQGEDVVAGIRTPQQITLAASRERAGREGRSEEERRTRYPSLEELMPDCFATLQDIAHTLEKHYKDAQDIEFTIQGGQLWMLQTRAGKRTAAAAVKIAVDMVHEGLIDERTAVLRVAPAQLDQFLHPILDPNAAKERLARGLPASPGAVSGEVVFSADDAEATAQTGHKVILVRVETSPEDIHGMHAAQGILTARGGATSHAALVSRGMGKCAVVGCEALEINYEQQQFKVRGSDVVIRVGEWITLDGSTGEVFRGQVPTRDPNPDTPEFTAFMSWADRFRRLRVRANADTPHDATVARRFGAEGIGLCRTEHMFFEGDRIDAVREMILAEDTEGRIRALSKIIPMQKGDFVSILRAMAGLPVTIRLLDPPLHEFLPNTEEEIANLATKLGVSVERLRAKRNALHEFNPMLGHRGCRLGITFPEIYEAQARAIMEAACELAREGVHIIPEIMVPLVGYKRELEMLRERIIRTCTEVTNSYGVTVPYTVGTMIEVPRAALVADAIAAAADFFSFGTNDLTQMTLGLSRDDAGKFLPDYLTQGIFPQDPFISLDQSGVGLLVELAVRKGRAARPDLKIGICGEHGGDPASVEFCHRAGLDYVSCSPYRVPIARLAAAQAALRDTPPKARRVARTNRAAASSAPTNA
ncbi:MAG TPA: pyruvate, phosphate dikinase [Candidatus Binatia bacterium]|jgi:pyruvate,orthophosphate dikinase|nr:pyruvate, phosphate dikinase [Candidatus Binatia bacterium]